MENFNKIHPHRTDHSSGVIDYDNYRHMKLRKAVSMGNGVYLIKKVDAADSAEALQEIYRLLQSGEIWIAKKNSGQYAGVGIEDKTFKSIVKERVIEGVVILEDISKKKTLRNLTEDEYTEIKKSIQNAIYFLKNQPSKSIGKSKKEELVKNSKNLKENYSVTLPASQKFSREGSKKKSVSTVKKELAKKLELQVQQNNNRKAKKSKELQEEKQEKDERIKEENLKWDIKQVNKKREDKN